MVLRLSAYYSPMPFQMQIICRLLYRMTEVTDLFFINLSCLTVYTVYFTKHYFSDIRVYLRSFVAI